MPRRKHTFLKLTKEQVADYNGFFDICRKSTDAAVSSGVDLLKRLHPSVKLTVADIATFNSFFAVCAKSSDPNVVAALEILETQIDDSEVGEKIEPPGDEP